MGANRRTSLTAALSLATLAIAWGAIPLFARIDVPATHLVAMRITLGAAVLLIAVAATGNLSLPTTHRGRLVLLGVLVSLHWVTFFLSLKLTSVAVALAVLYLGPVLAALLSGPMLGERVGWRAVGGLALALTGTMLVIRPGSGANATGVIVALVSATLLAVLMIVGKPAASSLGGLTVATSELVIASVLLLPFTVQAVRESGEHWAQFVVLGGVFTGLAGVVYWGSMRHLPVAVTSVIMYLEPASAVVWAALFLDERPAAATWFGVALVIAGGTLAALEAAEEEAIGAPATL